MLNLDVNHSQNDVFCFVVLVAWYLAFTTELYCKCRSVSINNVFHAARAGTDFSFFPSHNLFELPLTDLAFLAGGGGADEQRRGLFSTMPSAITARCTRSRSSIDIEHTGESSPLHSAEKQVHFNQGATFGLAKKVVAKRRRNLLQPGPQFTQSVADLVWRAASRNQ